MQSPNYNYEMYWKWAEQRDNVWWAIQKNSGTNAACCLARTIMVGQRNDFESKEVGRQADKISK